MKSADGAEKFENDIKNGRLNHFLLKCLLFTCLETQNHMRSFTGSDNRFYKNELCLDGTNGETVAMKELKKLELNEKELKLMNQWKEILKQAKLTKNYNSQLTYGVYQISKELDTSTKNNLTQKTKYDYIELHSALTALKNLVKEYYNSEIVPILFKYEFLK